MAVNQTRVRVPRQVVWDVLRDGWLFPLWVVGTSHTRAVQSDWPAAGSKLFHAAGAWPVMTRDESTVVAADDGARLELSARGRPVGRARVVIELADDGDGCVITLRENPSSAVARVLHNPLSDALLRRRNTESLARLSALCERRTTPED